MPFTPWPRSFVADLRRLDRRRGRALDLGCGDGALVRRLRAAGVPALGLDLGSPSLGVRADVRGDARASPFVPGGMDLLIACNLVRHLLAADPAGRFLDHWASLLRPGGRLYIFEDEPAAAPHAAANYRDLQLLLARLAPRIRGPLLPWDGFAALLRDRPQLAPAGRGCRRNLRPAHAEPVLHLLEGCAGTLDGEPSRLIAAVRRHGLSYGRYWWVRLRRAG